MNVLLALAFEDHVHHAAAEEWFAERGRNGWATCSVTESRFVRLASNPTVSEGTVTPEAAANQLSRMIQQGAHDFWPDATSFGAEPSLAAGLVGYRRATDAHLLQLTRLNGGRFATFDRGIQTLARGEEVELLFWTK